MDNPSNAPTTVPPRTQAAPKGGKLKVKKDPLLGGPPGQPAASRSDSLKASRSEATHGTQTNQQTPAHFAAPGAHGHHESPEHPLPQHEHFGPLPESYHHDTLFLVARDPRWLFSYWDFDWSRVPASSMRDGRQAYYLRVTKRTGSVESIVEIHPSARNWYLPVHQGNTDYRAELGYFDAKGAWCCLIRSGEARTPADAIAEDSQSQEFATVPQGLSFEQLSDLVQQHMSEGESLLGAIARITGAGRFAMQPGSAPTWTEEQKRLLAMLLGESLINVIGLGSEEIDRLLRKALAQKLHSEVSSGLAASFGASPSSLSSPFGASWSAQPFGIAKERGFFMNLNAEIIFYGGTDPAATVTVNGKPVMLQNDGSFRFHFTLPDGEFEIPIVATSPDGLEQRSGTLSFRRQTERAGGVDDTAQPRQLEPLIGRKFA